MTYKHPVLSLLLLGLGLGFGTGVSAGSGCTGAMEPPACVLVDDSGDVHPDYHVTNRCSYAVTLYFDVHEEGDDWVLDRTNFTAVIGYMAVQPNDTGQSAIRYDAELTVHCCPDLEGTSCSEPSSPEEPE